MGCANRPSASLSLLLAASAALTCAKSASADETESAQRAGYRFSEYDENAFSGPIADGDPRRYKVYSQQFQLDTKVADRTNLSIGATHEVMSGSSPWFLVPGADNRPVQVLSGATIRDHRSELQASLVRDSGGNDTSTFSASYSRERDYRATALGAERSIPLNPTLTLGFGGSFSHDIIEPTDALAFGRVQREQKNTVSVFSSIAWVLSRSAVLQSGIQLDQQNGYLSDPYKLVFVDNHILHDTRPGERTEAAWLVRYRYAVTSLDAALHLDYRLALDSWGQTSHTLEASWYQTLGHGWRLVPGVRYYTQDQARFYAPLFLSRDGRNFFSSDYRLGSYGALAANLNLRKRIGHWDLSVGGERYHAATRYAFGGGDGADPAVVSYLRVFAGLDYLFD